MNKITLKNLIIIAVIVGVLIIPGLVVYLTQGKIEGKSLSAEKVGEKVISYINENILKGQATASLEEIVKENGLYKLKIKIGDQEIFSYASRDGKLLFPDFIELEKTFSTQETSTEIPKTEKPEVKLFVMSFCPYGNQAEDIIRPVINLLGDQFDIVLHYIVSKDANGKYSSLHGDQELSQDIRELCVFKYQKDKFWDFVEGINKSCTYQNADACWENIANDLGINIQKIKDCQKTEANSLLEQELKIVEEYKVSGSPQIFVNGVEYDGNRTSDAYKEAICSGFNTPPSECQTKLSTDASSSQGGCQ